jgi:hypothetical protein
MQSLASSWAKDFLIHGQLTSTVAVVCLITWNLMCLTFDCNEVRVVEH